MIAAKACPMPAARRQLAVCRARSAAAPVPLQLRTCPLAAAPMLPRRMQLVPRAAAAGDDATPKPAVPPAADSSAVPAPKPAAAKAPSKPRLPGLDSLRFFLIAYIGVGHFISFATKDAFILKLMTQINVWVGAFFVLSGYVAGYTATELGKYEASARVKPEGAYTIARVAGYYPLFLLVNILFGAVFIFADVTFNGPLSTAFHGFLSATLTQAWFPAHAEIWNAPTWFLSALTFAMIVLPYTLPWIASLRRKGLVRLLVALTAASLIGKVAYSYDLNAWNLLEGVTSPKAHPNQLFWNVTRFHPFYALLEVLMGVAAARLVMVKDLDDSGKPKPASDAKPAPAWIPAVGLLAITAARAAGALPLNDPLTRCLLFIPLFIILIMRIHENTLAGAKGFTGLLGTPLLNYLGTISFPIFILHGAIGQVFYKKIIATKLWGSVMGQEFFPAYCAVVLVSAAAVQKFFLENKKVQEISGNITKKITSAVA